YGRQLSIARPDGTRSTVAIFDHKGRLYQIEGKSLSTGNDATAATIRFAQSLVFTGGGSNRSPEEIQAARAACRGAAAGEATGEPGAVAAEVAHCRQRRREREGG